VFVFELRLVNALGLITAEKEKNGNLKAVDPFVNCPKCGTKTKLEMGIATVVINEFQLANMLRVLETRNKELYKRINDFYERVTDAVEFVV
jgi:hypothetical protein